MTDYVQTGFNTAIAGSTLLASNDTLTVLQGGSIVLTGNSTIGYAVNASTTNVTILGLIDVGYFGLGTSGNLFIGTTGVLITHSFGGSVNIGGTFGFAVAQNQGTILGLHTFGLEVTGGGNAIQNSGSITAYTYSVDLGSDFSLADSLDNSGTIRCTYNAAVIMHGNNELVNNTGTITCQFGNGITVEGEWDGSAAIQGLQRIENAGMIWSDNLSGIFINMSDVGSFFSLDNSGTVHGLTVALNCGNETDQITNSGLLDGAVLLAGGDDLFITRGGTVTGDVDLGGGADGFYGTGATILGTVTGGAGNDLYVTDDAGLSIFEAATPGEIDTVYASVTFRLADNIENLVLKGNGNFNGFGNGSVNTIVGNAGDNRLIGLDGNDTIGGDLGNDRILGGNQNDSLSGDDGDDTLLGNVGIDVLKGGDGDDSLNGGIGKDSYSGGGGADSFVFSSITHSGNTQGTADGIADFVQGDDLIILVSIDAISTNGNPNDTFTFIGSAAFSNVAGQVHFVQSAGSTFVEMDVNGDSIADCVVKLTGTFTLNASDFVL